MTMKERCGDNRFRESQREYLVKQRNKRIAGDKKGPRKRTPVYDSDDLFVDFRDGKMVYVDAKGRDISKRARRTAKS